jgi:hypothetical protein
MGLAPWVQAIADFVLALVTSITLWVVIKYAGDTKTIAENSSVQIENAQMPFVAIVMLTDPERTSNWAIKNQGRGTALNIHYTRYLPDKLAISQWMTPLAPGELYPLPKENDQQMPERGFTVEYESLSGMRYRTTVEWESGSPKTTFLRFR